jgi:hypothetical protein
MNPITDIAVGSIGTIVTGIRDIADDLYTSDAETAQLNIDGYKAETERLVSQTEINKVEAASNDKFTSRWRPSVGWVCVAGLAYQFVAYPFLIWGWAAMQAVGWISIGLMAPPEINIETLMVLLSAILGVGTLRTVDKIKGVSK